MQLNQNLTEQLYLEFPCLYRSRHKTMYESGMCWGFQCGDGWFQILYDLSQKLSDYLIQHPAVDFEVTQVKSKLGFLHVGLSFHNEDLRKLIGLACQQAQITCELTGKPGKLYEDIPNRAPIVLSIEKAVDLGWLSVGK
ncbi:MAG: hypothetical protein ABL868_00750 [Sulfuriferula sp.]